MKQPDCHSNEKHIAKGLCRDCYGKAYYAENKDKIAAYGKAWYAENPEKMAAYKKAYYATQNGKKVNRESKWRQYGIKDMTVELYEKMLKEQNGKCFICGSLSNGRNLDVDHSHETGEVRGLLCAQCNGYVVPFAERVGQMGIERLTKYVGI